MSAFLRFEISRSLRNVRFLVFIVGFPVILYLIYAKQHGISPGLTVAATLMVAMAVWSGMGSAMLQVIGQALPAHHLNQLALNAVAGTPLGMGNVLALAAWTAGLGLIATWRWRQESAAA